MPSTLTKELTERGNFRAKVEVILLNGKARGYPFVIHNALRSQALQDAKVAAGFSKTKRSKHLAGKDGKASAVDIICPPHLWGAHPDHVWVMLGRLALTQGCDWGGLWGLPWGVRRKLKAFLLDRTKPFDEFAWHGPLGWDRAHVQRKGWI